MISLDQPHGACIMVGQNAGSTVALYVSLHSIYDSIQSFFPRNRGELTGTFCTDPQLWLQ
jgi:hypothetical protein